MMNILTHNIREWGTDAFNLKVNMGWQHLIMEGDLARYIALLAYRSVSGIAETTARHTFNDNIISLSFTLEINLWQGAHGYRIKK